jgi:hypothetical protein
VAFFDPIVTPQNSIIIALTSAGFVAGAYFATVGPIADVHAMPANDPTIEKSLTKAGVMALILVGGLTVFTRDLNDVIVGGTAIIVLDLMYRHAHQSSPMTNQVVAPSDSGNQSTANVVQITTATNQGGPLEASAG